MKARNIIENHAVFATGIVNRSNVSTFKINTGVILGNVQMQFTTFTKKSNTGSLNTIKYNLSCCHTEPSF